MYRACLGSFGSTIYICTEALNTIEFFLNAEIYVRLLLPFKRFEVFVIKPIIFHEFSLTHNNLGYLLL